MTSKTKKVKKPSFLLFITEPGRAAFEYGLFLASKAILNKMPEGDKHPVLVLPGFMADDCTTKPLRGFLKDQGYEPQSWGLGRNFAKMEYIEQLEGRLTELYEEYGEKVSLIGWSLGGVYARELARNIPDKVRQVITLGSPFAGLKAKTNISWIYRLVSGKRIEDVEEDFMKEILKAPPVPVTAIYSKWDGIVNWKTCMEQEQRNDIQNVRVLGSHCGLGHNVAALMCIANRLAQPTEDWQLFKPNWAVKGLFPKLAPAI